MNTLVLSLIVHFLFDGVCYLCTNSSYGEDFNVCLCLWFLRLIGLKNIFARQLPNMPKEYIVRLVMDR
jgi:hypothetical protein